MFRAGRLALLALCLLAIAAASPGADSTVSGAPSSLTFRAMAPGIAADSPPLGANSEVAVCPGGPRHIAIIVDPALATALREDITRFEINICDDGYTVVERRSPLASPPDVRSYLADLYSRTNSRLAGAILIGDVPHAYQWVQSFSTNPAFPPITEEVISFQYYADLDGTFARSPGYVSPGGHAHSFDQHTGATDWEIWVGVLPMYNGNRDQTVTALRQYFARNHAYRATTAAFARQFLEVNEHFVAHNKAESDFLLAEMVNGQYSWTPMSSQPSARLHFHSSESGLSVEAGYARLASEGADLTVTDTHGYWGASGQLTITDVENEPVRTLFFWSNGCAVGDIDRASNFLTSVVYSPTSSVLVAKGTTNDSGGMGTNSAGFFGHNVAAAMVGGTGIGDAIVGHVNVPLIWPWSEAREFHYATPIVIGDPTLRLPSTYD